MLDDESHFSRQLRCTAPSVPVQSQGDSRLSPFAPSWQIRQKGQSLDTQTAGDFATYHGVSLPCFSLGKLLFSLQYPAPNILSILWDSHRQSNMLPP